MVTVRDTMGAWFALSRPPFHSVGVLPFILGGVLAWQQNGAFRWDVWFWGALGVVFIMLATYYAGEYWDHVEDSLSGKMDHSHFAGGSQVLQRGFLPRHAALRASLACLLLAAGVGLLLQMGYKTGPLTIPLGVLGMIGGFFYSAKPLRWVQRGWGELWIALCYGWLPVAVGYYLQVGNIAPLVNWVAIPIGLTIFNVILLNEFLDYSADVVAEKSNMVVRFGRDKASYLFGITTAGSWIGVLYSLNNGVPIQIFWPYLPILTLSIISAVLVMSKRWHDRTTLNRLCATTLVVNLGTTSSYIVAFAR